MGLSELRVWDVQGVDDQRPWIFILEMSGVELHAMCSDLRLGTLIAKRH